MPDPQKVDGRLGTGSNLSWPAIPGLTFVPNPNAVDSATVSTGGGGGSTPAPSFDPGSLGNLVGWWQSYAGIASSPVATWVDQSGAGNDLAAAGAARPTLLVNQLNGRAAVVFDGVANFMQVTIGGLVQPATLYLLVKQTAWVSNRRITDGITNDSFTLHQKTTTPNLAFYANNALLQSTDLAVNTWGVVTIVANAASSLLQINNNAAVTGNPGNNAIGGFTLGALSDGSLPGNIAVVEAILRSQADDADVRQAHIDYLAGIGGLSI